MTAHTRNNVTELELPEPRFIEPGHYMIDSFKVTLISYHLRLNEFDNWVCSCPHYTFHFECKHARHLIAWFAEQMGEKYDIALYGTKKPLAPMGVFVGAPKKELTLEDLFEDVA